MVKGYILYNFNSFKFGKVCFWSQDMVYFVMFHMHFKRIYIWLFWGYVFYKYQLVMLVDTVIHSFSFTAIFLHLFYHLTRIKHWNIQVWIYIYSILLVFVLCYLKLFFAYTYRTARSSWWINCFHCLTYLFLPQVFSLFWRSIYLIINTLKISLACTSHFPCLYSLIIFNYIQGWVLGTCIFPTTVPLHLIIGVAGF